MTETIALFSHFFVSLFSNFFIIMRKKVYFTVNKKFLLTPFYYENKVPMDPGNHGYVMENALLISRPEIHGKTCFFCLVMEISLIHHQKIWNKNLEPKGKRLKWLLFCTRSDMAMLHCFSICFLILISYMEMNSMSWILLSWITFPLIV